MCNCYIIITSRSFIWFLLSLVASMSLLAAFVLPKWLIGPEVIRIDSSNFTLYRYPSVGIYGRCKMMDQAGYHCGNFDLSGLATDASIYPTAWKVTMVFLLTGLMVLCVTLLLTLATCFTKQSIFGKSLHNVTGSMQVIAGMCVLGALFAHPLGWAEPRVKTLCGPDAEMFAPSECTIGLAMYLAVTGAILCFTSAIISLKAESANSSSKIQRRIEEGEVLVCVP